MNELSGRGRPEDAAARVTEEMISELVQAFYARARRDPTLGPIFDRVIGERWDEHLAKMRDFWSAVVLGTRRFRGAPAQAHPRIEGLSATHFGRWLYLFRKAARETCAPDVANLFILKAEGIAERLEAAVVAARHGRSLALTEFGKPQP
jgi:hemoglobin